MDARNHQDQEGGIAIREPVEPARVTPAPVVYPPPVGSALPPANGGYNTPGPPFYGSAPNVTPAYIPPARRGANPLVMILLGLIALLVIGLIVSAALAASALLRETRALQVGQAVTRSESVPLGGATAANIQISNGIGKLTLAGGAANLLDANFTYNVEQWRPEVTYDLRGQTGYLSVRQPSTNGNVVGSTRNEWDLRLTDGVPMDLTVNLGVGSGDLKLGGLDLTRLEVDIGVGSATIDLSGAWSHAVPITIRGGVGQTILMLPRDTAVQVTAHNGLGKVHADGFHVNGDVYTNDRYGNGPATLAIDVNLGLGDLTLEQAK